jgi:hypothetical protein
MPTPLTANTAIAHFHCDKRSKTHHPARRAPDRVYTEHVIQVGCQNCIPRSVRYPYTPTLPSEFIHRSAYHANNAVPSIKHYTTQRPFAQPTCMTCLKAFSNSSSSSAMRSFSIMRAASASDLYTPRQSCYNEHNKQSTAQSSGL